MTIGRFEDEPDPEEPNEEGEGGGGGRRLALIPHTVDAILVFRFEFGPAILAQVLEKLSALPTRPLTDAALADAIYPGFYQLFRDDQSVYVGRTIRPVRTRLLEHIKKLRGRVPLRSMTCKFLFVEDLSLVGLSEDSLISYFHPLGLDEWGTMGFGSKATGHNRAGQGSDWHERYPPDLHTAVSAGGPDARTLEGLIRQIGRQAPIVLSLPIKFRGAFRQRFALVQEEIAEQTRGFDQWIAELERRLAPDWRVDRRPMAWYVIPYERD